MTCQFTTTPNTDGTYTHVCQGGFQYTTATERVFRRCTCDGVPQAPGVVAKVGRAATAHVIWAAAGFPRRSEEQVAEAFAICQACDHFRPRGSDNGVCGKCGCHLGRTGGLLNKLAMATEDCPLGKWPKLDKSTPADMNQP